MEEVDRCMEIVSSLADLHPYLRWNAVAQWPHRLLLDGRVDEAEQRTYEAFQVAQADEQPDAAAVMAAQIVMVRWDQGRLPEMEPVLAQTVADNPGIPGFRALLAIALCEAERHGEARHIFRPDADDGFAAFQYNTLWLTSMVMLAEVCARLEERDAAADLFQRLKPWQDQIVMSGISVFGAVAHYLGQLATTLEDFDEGEAQFRRATELYERIGAVTFLARTQLSWARLLLARGGPGDRDQAAELREAVAVTADQVGLGTLARRAAALS